MANLNYISNVAKALRVLQLWDTLGNKHYRKRTENYSQKFTCHTAVTSQL